MTEHLLVSTALLVLVMMAAPLLPLTARTRYALLLFGIAKFAVPTAVFRFVPIEVVPVQLRTFGGGAAAAIAPFVAARTINWIAIAWAAIAALIFVHWVVLRARTVSAALRSPAPASARELEAVREARLTMNIRTAIDVIRSPICEAPAVLRIIRPVIVLPAHGCDELTDDELRSIVLHECAHVARHDNFLSLIQALATSLLFFHPLVWLASNRITVAREEACDESVADAMRDTGAYVDALTKICRAFIAPRTAGASCMASAKLKERLKHLMSYETIKRRAWSHRAIVAAGVLLIALSTIAATPVNSKALPYSLKFNVTNMGNQMRYDIEVVDVATGKVVVSPRLVTQGDDVLSTTSSTNGPEYSIRIIDGMKPSAAILLEVTDNGKMLQRTLYTKDQKTYEGEPVSITVRDADIRDLLGTFGDLTGLKIDIAPDVQGKVTLDVSGVPWDKALADLLDANGLAWTIEGNTLHVRRK
ncbi:MAG TPA: M56 family metallopeptidase [Thermoanaerobaculia bacterium]|nr:M56 family metallopeptidase [Thermoanaerobaculia bacterium]